MTGPDMTEEIKARRAQRKEAIAAARDYKDVHESARLFREEAVYAAKLERDAAYKLADEQCAAAVKLADEQQTMFVNEARKDFIEAGAPRALSGGIVPAALPSGEVQS